MTRPPVAILPSLDEPATIAGVVGAVDGALDDPAAVIVLADASPTRATAAAFDAVTTRARLLCLTGLTAGKGRQILAALHHLTAEGALGAGVAVLLADTDTRNPDPATYRALLHPITAGAAGIALPDYQRFWDEANLTNHLARPLIAAGTGHDVAQPLAGDAALTTDALHRALAHHRALPGELAAAVEGYGIDAFLLQVAAGTGPVISVVMARTKQHAPSFPHLPAIFADAVPVLLRPATTAPTPAVVGRFRVANRELPATRRKHMARTLRALRPSTGRYDELSWPHAVAAAWRAVAAGAGPITAAGWLWPAYLDHVHAWLTVDILPHRRAEVLRADAAAVLDLLTTGKDHPS